MTDLKSQSVKEEWTFSGQKRLFSESCVFKGEVRGHQRSGWPGQGQELCSSISSVDLLENLSGRSLDVTFSLHQAVAFIHRAFILFYFIFFTWEMAQIFLATLKTIKLLHSGQIGTKSVLGVTSSKEILFIQHHHIILSSQERQKEGHRIQMET